MNDSHFLGSRRAGGASKRQHSHPTTCTWPILTPSYTNSLQNVCPPGVLSSPWESNWDMCMESETHGEGASCLPPSLFSPESPQKRQAGRQGQLSSFRYAEMGTAAYRDLPEGASRAVLGPTSSSSRVQQVGGLESAPSQARVMQVVASPRAGSVQLPLGPAAAQTGDSRQEVPDCGPESLSLDGKVGG